MAKAIMPAGFWEAAEPYLPPDKPVGPRGGRPPIANRVALRVVWYVLTAGVRWQEGPAGPAEADAGRGVRRPRVRQRADAADRALAGDRAAHRQARDGARVRAGKGALGGGADDRLDQGAAADARALGPARERPGRLEHLG